MNEREEQELVEDYLTAENIFSNPEPDNSFARTREAYLAEIRAEGPIDKDRLRKGQDWSVLNGLVVGAEDPSRHY